MTDDQSKRLLGHSQNLNYNLSNVAISCSGDQSGKSSTYTSTDHNGSQIFIPSAGQEQHLDQADNSTNGGLQLVHLLLGCAEAIDASEYERAGDLLCHLRAISSPQGDPMQRIAFHFAEALSDRRQRHNNNTNMSNFQYDQYRHKASYCDLVRPATNSTSRNAAASTCNRPTAAAALVQQLHVSCVHCWGRITIHDTLVHDLVGIKQHFVTETIQAIRQVDLVELIEVVVQVALLSIFFTVLLLIILLIDPGRISGISAELLQPSNERAVASNTRASCKLLRIENDGRAGLDLARRNSRPVA